MGPHVHHRSRWGLPELLLVAVLLLMGWLLFNDWRSRWRPTAAVELTPGLFYQSLPDNRRSPVGPVQIVTLDLRQPHLELVLPLPKSGPPEQWVDASARTLERRTPDIAPRATAAGTAAEPETSRTTGVTPAVAKVTDPQEQSASGPAPGSAATRLERDRQTNGATRFPGTSDAEVAVSPELSAVLGVAATVPDRAMPSPVKSPAANTSSDRPLRSEANSTASAVPPSRPAGSAGESPRLYPRIWLPTTVQRERWVLAIGHGWSGLASDRWGWASADVPVGTTILAAGRVGRFRSDQPLLWFDDTLTARIESTPVRREVLTTARWGLGGVSVPLRDGFVVAEPDPAVGPRTLVGVDHSGCQLTIAVFDNAAVGTAAQWLRERGVWSAIELVSGEASGLVIGPNAAGVTAGPKGGPRSSVATFVGVRIQPPPPRE